MNEKLFYILNLTWGLPMNIVGAIVALVLICTKHRPTVHGGCLCFEVGKGWGGVSFGLFMLVSKTSGTHTRNHEFGHAIQNARYGIAHVGLSLASAVRYHWRNFQIKRNPLVELPPYDAFWFEGQATELGEKYIKYFEGKEDED